MQCLKCYKHIILVAIGVKWYHATFLYIFVEMAVRFLLLKKIFLIKSNLLPGTGKKMRKICKIQSNW